MHFLLVVLSMILVLKPDCEPSLQGQVVGSILFASNASTKATALIEAATLVTNGSTYNNLLTQSATSSLNSWMSSNASASLLSSSSYAGIAVPANFSYTYLNVTNIQVLNASVANSTVESLLGLSSTAQHYAMTVWMNITVLVGYSVGSNASSTSGRRLLQASDGLYTDSDAVSFGLQTHGHVGKLQHSGDQDIQKWVQSYEQRLHAEQQQPDVGTMRQLLSQAGTKGQRRRLPSQVAVKKHSPRASKASSIAAAPKLGKSSACYATAAQLSNSDSLALSNGTHHLARQLQTELSLESDQPQHSTRQLLQTALSYSWQSPLNLQLKLLEKAFLDTSVCNATLVAQQLGLNSSVSSLNCTNSTALMLLTNLLSAGSTGGSSPPLSVLMIADSPSSTQSTSSVDANSGIEASVKSTLSIMLQNYDRQIAELLAMALTELNTVNTLQGVISIKKTYVKKFITTAQNYITVTTSFVETALTLFGISTTTTSSNSRSSASTYVQLVQSTLADDVEADNNLYASASFQAALQALVPSCNRDSLGNRRFSFAVAAAQSQEIVTANATLTATASTSTVILNETASNCPSKLVDSSTGYCVDVWSGYSVVQVSSMPAAKVVAEKVTGHRHRIGWDGNVVVGGLLLHQVQILLPLACFTSQICCKHVFEVSPNSWPDFT